VHTPYDFRAELSWHFKFRGVIDCIVDILLSTGYIATSATRECSTTTSQRTSFYLACTAWHSRVRKGRGELILKETWQGMLIAGRWR
jgi:hypothetical protein